VQGEVRFQKNVFENLGQGKKHPMTAKRFKRKIKQMVKVMCQYKHEKSFQSSTGDSLMDFVIHAT